MFRNSNSDPSIGFLTYDLQPFTEDCIYAISLGIQPISLCAYPIFYNPFQENTRFPYLPSTLKGKYLGISVNGSTPEGLVSNMNWYSAWKCVKQSNVIVLFGLQGSTALLTAFLGSLMGRSIISVNQTLPIQWERKRRWWIKLLKKWLLGRCSYHIYQTPASKDVLIKEYGIKEENLYFAPFEAGASWFREILKKHKDKGKLVREQLNLKDEVLYLFVGNLHPFKGVSDIIQAAGRMPKGAHFTCVFAGPEELRNKVGGTIQYYLELAGKLGVENHIRFLGVLPPDKLASLYWGSDVVMLPTYRETFGKILVEGALASKPLITTSACGAAGSMVVAGDNGFIVEPGDLDSLVAAMSSLLDIGLRERMGRRSSEIVNGFCDKDAETRGFLAAIRQALLGYPSVEKNH